MTIYTGYTERAHKSYSDYASRFVDDYRETHPTRHLFDKEKQKYFGERISEMRVLKNLATVTDYSGNEHKCFVLSTYRHKYSPNGQRRNYYYFDIENLAHVLAKEIKK